MENDKHLFEKLSEYYSDQEAYEKRKQELEADAEGKTLFQWVDRFWNSLNPQPDSVDRIKAQTYQKIKSSGRKEKRILLTFMKYAAVVLVAFVLGGLIHYYSHQEVKMLTVASGVGQVKEVQLPDGSKAWLNAQSEITYPETFSDNSRNVTALGEVYFEVVHNEKLPFVVKSGKVNIRVLGTSFMVTNYQEEPEVKTYLAKGSVELQFDGLNSKTQMVPGDEVTFEKATSEVIKVHNPQVSPDAWRFGGISFYGESLSEIARKLERKFGTEVKIEGGKLAEMKFSFDFDTESLEQILQYLSAGSSMKYRKTAAGYILTEK